jgi:hypothetical protein
MSNDVYYLCTYHLCKLTVHCRSAHCTAYMRQGIEMANRFNILEVQLAEDVEN